MDARIHLASAASEVLPVAAAVMVQTTSVSGAVNWRALSSKNTTIACTFVGRLDSLVRGQRLARWVSHTSAVRGSFPPLPLT